IDLEEYNEAIVHLKKLELTSEYKVHYGYAVSNLMVCYFEMGDLAQAADYAMLVKNYDQSTDAEIAKAYLYEAKIMFQEGNVEP
ncbi:hypothetical protein, partial [Pandoraea pneumonica]